MYLKFFLKVPHWVTVQWFFFVSLTQFSNSNLLSSNTPPTISSRTLLSPSLRNSSNSTTCSLPSTTTTRWPTASGFREQMAHQCNNMVATSKCPRASYPSYNSRSMDTSSRCNSNNTSYSKTTQQRTMDSSCWWETKQPTSTGMDSECSFPLITHNLTYYTLMILPPYRIEYIYAICLFT